MSQNRRNQGGPHGRGMMAGDLIDVIGLAVDALEERAMMVGYEFE